MQRRRGGIAPREWRSGWRGEPARFATDPPSPSSRDPGLRGEGAGAVRDTASGRGRELLLVTGVLDPGALFRAIGLGTVERGLQLHVSTRCPGHHAPEDKGEQQPQDDGG